LGNDEESRRRALRETTRGSMNWMSQELETDDLRWVAGIHRNTDNPHIHLLIHREYTQRKTGHIRRLKTLPKEMRVSWHRAPDGERMTDPGGLRQTFRSLLEKQIKQERVANLTRGDVPTNSPQLTHKERLLLGRALIAQDKINRLTRLRDDTILYGDRYRYDFSNGCNLRRGFSEHDIERRGTAKAAQLLAESPAILSSEARREYRSRLSVAEFERHDELVQKHREIRAQALQKIEMNLSRAISATSHLVERGQALKEKFEAEHGVAPTPILPRNQLSKLQDAAIERRETDRVNVLEGIRSAIAAESGAPTRTNWEIDRLKAQLFVAQAYLTAEQNSKIRFEETKHHLKWEAPDEFGTPSDQKSLIKKSLTEIERSLAWEQDQSQFIGTRRLHWDDDRRNLARDRVEELSRLRETTLDRVEAERAEISDRILHQARFVDALSRIVDKEDDHRQKTSPASPPAIFSRQELQELDNIALRLRDPQFSRALLKIEREYDDRTDTREMISLDERARRALAREQLAEIEVRESELHLASVRERRGLVDVIVQDDGKRVIEIARLADIPPAPPLERLLRPLIIPDERQAKIILALDTYERRLLERRETAFAHYELLQQEAWDRQSEFSEAYPKKSPPSPLFTAGEMSRLELHAARETDPAFKEKYEMLYRNALQHPYENRSRLIVIEKDADDLLNPVSLHISPDADPNFQASIDRVPGTENSRQIEFER
jgi:hypothetical protein